MRNKINKWFYFYDFLLSIFSEEHKNDTEDLDKIEKYEGFSLDLFKAIAKKAKMNNVKYKVLEKTYKYGDYNKDTKEWDGLINDIIKHEADFAIGDITITQLRKTAVDFSISFETLGKLRRFPSSFYESI